MSGLHTPKMAALTGKSWWPWLKRASFAVFFMLVAGLLVTQARAIKWDAVFVSLAMLPLSALLSAVTLAVLSLTLYSSFDLLGRHYTGHTLRAGTVMRITFISYMFNLNLGSLVGAVAMRYRLYSRAGLGAGAITRILTVSMLTNWMGYLLLAGAVFCFQSPRLPPSWKIGNASLQFFGAVMLAMSLSYLLLCAFSRQRSFTLRGHALQLPSLRLAGLQLGMGATNWLLMGTIVYMLLEQRIAYATVLGVLLVAVVAGLIFRVPAGLGVLEAVFIMLLSPRLPNPELLAALLAYRAIYYLAPLTLAAVLYLMAELQARKSARSARQRSAP